MSFFRLPRRQGFIIIALGFASGYYIWNEPLKKYNQEHFVNTNLNKEVPHGTE
ncbi:hypothetical protein WH47_03484 [Habropoda laboriosa]|uniref:Uncharacterized protein n=1 Tax=Habropoda laboriosa TaxID=597456 RepID=A0A0L7RC38_9HYME|nr:hypothetical protein WH47_03484 [Habropoda laboriosa]